MLLRVMLAILCVTTMQDRAFAFDYGGLTSSVIETNLYDKDWEAIKKVALGRYEHMPVATATDLVSHYLHILEAPQESLSRDLQTELALDMLFFIATGNFVHKSLVRDDAPENWRSFGIRKKRNATPHEKQLLVQAIMVSGMLLKSSVDAFIKRYNETTAMIRGTQTRREKAHYDCVTNIFRFALRRQGVKRVDVPEPTEDSLRVVRNLLSLYPGKQTITLREFYKQVQSKYVIRQKEIQKAIDSLNVGASEESSEGQQGVVLLPPPPPPPFTVPPKDESRASLGEKIREGIQLRKVQYEQNPKKGEVSDGLTAILARRIAVADSDDEEDGEEEAWSDSETGGVPKAAVSQKDKKVVVVPNSPKAQRDPEEQTPPQIPPRIPSTKEQVQKKDTRPLPLPPPSVVPQPKVDDDPSSRTLQERMVLFGGRK